jgi:hypothetical protein
MRTYDTGATRSDLGGKIQYEGFISPVALKRFGEYMRKHQIQEDGEIRAADNWQQGMPIEDYMDSLLRHVIEAWLWHREHYDELETENMLDALCGVFFNTQGLLHELSKLEELQP